MKAHAKGSNNPASTAQQAHGQKQHNQQRNRSDANKQTVQSSATYKDSRFEEHVNNNTKMQVQMKSKLRQHSNNNSVNLCKPLSSADNVAGALLADMAAPNAMMNNSIDNINNYLVQQQKMAQQDTYDPVGVSQSLKFFEFEGQSGPTSALDSQNNEQDLFFVQRHIAMNEEQASSNGEEQELMEDEDDQQGVLNYLAKLDCARNGISGGAQQNDNNKSSIQGDELAKAHNKDSPPGGKLSSKLLQLEIENSADSTRIKVPIRGPEHKKIINTGERLIGDYRVERTLGQGTFGKVKQGYHIFTGQKVAIKILDKWKIDDVNDIERVAREIHILRIVRHPTIIQLYEIIETKNRLFLIMEHCCNGELFNYITSKNHLKEDEACRLFQQLISGIEYLGELGIAHRDIKPENLLLDQQKNLKIVDFGLSNTFKPNEKLVTACGSPCYAAPELIKGLEYIGPKADIWSAGVVLYCLVCGHLPFEDQNTQSLYQKILSANYQFTCYLSQEVRNLIENILVPEPALRYGLKQIKQNSWFNLYKGESLKQSHQETSVYKEIKVHNKLIREMKKQSSSLDMEYAKCCISANQKNNVTAHYHLLLKKKSIMGESISDLSNASQGLITVLDQNGNPVKKNNDALLNEKPVPGGKQVRDFHSIPAAPRHNFANLERLTSQQQQQYGYQMKKMNVGLIDLKNQKNNDQVLMNIETNSADQQSLQWDYPDQEDGARGGGQSNRMNYQAQKKNNAQIKKIVDKNHALNIPQSSQRGARQQKINNSQNLQGQKTDPQKAQKVPSNQNANRTATQNKRAITTGSINHSQENQPLSYQQQSSQFNQNTDDQEISTVLDDYTINMQASLNQGSQIINFDQMSNGQAPPAQRDNLQKSNASRKNNPSNTISKVNSATRNLNERQTPGKNSKKVITNSSHQRQINKQQRQSENKRATYDSSARNVSKLSVNSANKYKRGDSSFIRPSMQKGIHCSISQVHDVGAPGGNATQTIVANAGSQFSTLQKKSQATNRDNYITKSKIANGATRDNQPQQHNNQSGQFIKQQKGSSNRINKNQVMGKAVKQHQISTMVTNLALNQTQINQKSQRTAVVHPQTGKAAGSTHQHQAAAMINKSNSITKKTKLKSSLVDFTRNGAANGHHHGHRAAQNTRAQMYNTSSSIDHALGQNESLSNQITMANSQGRRNDPLNSHQYNSQIVQASQGGNSLASSNQASKVSRKHIRANTSINNYNASALNGLAASNQQQQALLNSYGPNQKSTMVTSAVGAVSAVKPISNMNSTDGTSNFQNGTAANNMNIQAAMSDQLKDKLNITNSLIISNSQILFQDIGNGKIIPIPFSQAMGTIQPTAQNQIEAVGPSHQGQTIGAAQHHHGPSQSMQVHHDRRVSQNSQHGHGNYRTSNSQDKQQHITSIRNVPVVHSKQQQNQTISHAQHLQGSGNNPRREHHVIAANSRQQRRKTAQSTRFNTLMQDYSGGVGLRDRNNDLQQSYRKTITTSVAFDASAPPQQRVDYNSQVMGSFKDNSKQSLHNTIVQGTHSVGPHKTQSQGPGGRSVNQRNQYRMVSMSLGNNSKNQVSAPNYRNNYNNGLNQTQGQRVISQITGSVQGQSIGPSQPSSMQNKIPTFHKMQNKGKHGISKSITDSAAINKNMTTSVGLSQSINRQNQKLNDQYRSHQNKESSEFFNSKEQQFGSTAAQITSKLNAANHRQSRQTQRVPILSQQVSSSQKAQHHVGPGPVPPSNQQKMKNARNMSNQSHHQQNSNQSQLGAGYQQQSGKGGQQKPINKSMSMNHTQNTQPISSLVKQHKQQQNQTQNLENQLTSLLNKQQDPHPQMLNKKNIEQNIQQINNKIYQMKVVGGTPQMMTNAEKLPKEAANHSRIHHTTSNQSKQYLSSMDRGQQKQKSLGMSGGSLHSFYASANAGSKVYSKPQAVMHQSIENGKISVQRSNNMGGSTLVDKSRDFDNMQAILQDQQRKLIRDNYLQGFQSNQPLGFTSTLENSRSAANYQKMGSNQGQGTGIMNQQSLAFAANNNVNTSMGAIQNNQDMKRNLRMIKMNKQGATQSSLNNQQ